MLSVRASHAVYELKVIILGIQPPIWRRIQVPSTILLCCLHDALQAVLGWTDSHLHQFEKEGKVWSDPELYEDDDIEVLNEGRFRLNRIVKKVGDSLGYQYDFGDNWQHEIVLEKIVSCETPVMRPICLSGARSCPPEDVGGVHGYSEFLAAIFDPDHDEFERYRTWAGDDFAPEHFDLGKVNSVLVRMRWPKRHRRTQ